MIGFKHTIGALAILLTIPLLSGCATLNEAECLTADWRVIGYEDGAQGQAASKIGEHRKACAKHGVVPNLGEYNIGRENGLREFCQPPNGYNLGLTGQGYTGICPPDLQFAFEDAYHQGRTVYTLKYKINTKQHLIVNKEAELKELDEKLSHLNEHIISNKTSSEDRAKALLESKDLTLKIGETKADINNLEQEIAELRGRLEEVTTVRIYQ